MSKYNSYAKRLDSVARTAFDEWGKAEESYKKAKQAADNYPPAHGMVNAEYAAKSARAQADYAEAKHAYEQAEKAFRGRVQDVQAICRELTAAVEADYIVDPARLDMGTVELLKSGMLTAADYDRLAQQALAGNNLTMLRMIGKYAQDAADALSAKEGTGDKQAMALRSVAMSCNRNPASARVEDINALAEIFAKCASNPGMIKHWDELTGNVVANF